MTCPDCGAPFEINVSEILVIKNANCRICNSHLSFLEHKFDTYRYLTKGGEKPQWGIGNEL